MNRFSWLGLSILTICLLSACSEPASKKPAAETDEPLKTTNEHASFVGKWFLVVSQNGLDIKLRHVTIRQGDSADKFDVEVQPTELAMPSAKLTSSRIEKNTIELFLEADETKIHFKGLLEEGQVRGSMTFDGQQCDPALLIPTEENDVTEKEVVERSEGYQLYVKAKAQSKPLPALQDFWDEFAESPLALTAHRQVLVLAAPDQYDEEEIEDYFESYLETAQLWGEQMVDHVRIEVGYLLAASRFTPQLAEKYLADADKHASKEILEIQKDKIELAHHLIKIEQARRDLEGTDESKFADAYQLLRDELQYEPYNAFYMLTLADFAEREKKTDDAIDLLARLSSMPLMTMMVEQTYQQQGIEKPLPRERLSRLWTEKNQSAEGLEEYLDTIYEKDVLAFLETTDIKPVEPSGNRSVLVELFTGSGCPPCVAADLGTEAIEQVYPDSSVIVLRYHEHNAGPDPLANNQSEARGFGFYKIQGTPFIYLNGIRLNENVGGYMQQVPDIYQTLRRNIDPLLEQTTELGIELQAEAVDGKLDVQALVTGAKKIDPNWRLVLALAEDDIHFAASNGIRVHDMVVRWMIGGPEGVKEREGKLQYSGKINLANLKEALASYLNSFEQGQGISFPDKPLELKPLHLVGFVQNVETKEILQSTVIPVTGELKYPELAEILPPQTTPSKEKRSPAPPLPTAEKKANPDGSQLNQPAPPAAPTTKTDDDSRTNDKPAPSKGPALIPPGIEKTKTSESQDKPEE